MLYDAGSLRKQQGPCQAQPGYDEAEILFQVFLRRISSIIVDATLAKVGSLIWRATSLISIWGFRFRLNLWTKASRKPKPGCPVREHGEEWCQEMPGEEPWLLGVWFPKINVCISSDEETCEEALGPWPLRTFQCKVYKVKRYDRERVHKTMFR